MGAARKQSLRHLVVVFGDQLDADSAAFDGFDERKDRVWMAEAASEAGHVWSSKPRIAYFFCAMRAFAEDLQSSGRKTIYHTVQSDGPSLGQLLQTDLEQLAPEGVIVVQPGEWRVQEGIRQVCQRVGVPLEVREDRHFFDTPSQFRTWAEGRKGIRLEFYYRELRKRHDILMTPEGKPEGGAWNFDKENRGSFGKKGPGPDVPAVPGFTLRKSGKAALEAVETVFADHPGSLDRFNWPTDREQALRALVVFIEERLPLFGTYQDAMWTGEDTLYHSLLSAALNCKLLNPREVVAAAEAAYHSGTAPLNAVEGFIRQILGWREYVRGIYWWKMPAYVKGNVLQAEAALPEFFWTGDTPYRCLQESIRQTLETGYAHHIQRLMVTGLYTLLLGVDPEAVHRWYLAVYVDAVEWVELPNVLGMSQYADGGLMASKPYAATGKYIDRMSNYCRGCPANPAEGTGESACPFTTLYWDFLIRNRERLSGNQRMGLQLKNVDRLSAERKAELQERATKVKADPSGETLFNEV